MLRLFLLSTVATIIPSAAYADPILTPILVAAGLTQTISIGAATISLASIVSTAITSGALYGLSQLFAPDTSLKIPTQQLKVKQSNPGLLHGYGLTKMGGAKFVFENVRGVLLEGDIHCAGPIDGFEQWFLNDTVTQLAPNNPGFTPGSQGGVNAVYPWTNVIGFDSFRGTKDQPASAYLKQFLPYWTDAHQLRGLAYTVQASYPVPKPSFQAVYGSGVPSVFTWARLALVYDPRDNSQDWNNDATFKFSANCSLCILHYLTQKRAYDPVAEYAIYYGFGINKGRINIQSFIDFANVCDQPVALKAGGTTPRYYCGGAYNMATDERRNVLAKLLTACDGEIYLDRYGKVSIRGGVWTEPTITLSASTGITGYNLKFSEDEDTVFNRLVTNFSDKFNDFAIVPGDPWDDFELQAQDDKIVEQSFTAEFVTLHSQVRRLAKIATKKGNPSIKGTITTNLAGLNALEERIIRVVIPELMIDETFLIKRFVENQDGISCTIEISSLDATAYEWDAPREEGVGPTPGSRFTPPATVIPAPTLIVVDTVRTGGLYLHIEAQDPNNPLYELKVQWRLYAAGQGAEDNWLDTNVVSPWVRETPSQNDRTVIEYRYAFWGAYGGVNRGTWTGPISYTLVQDTVAPGVVTNVSVALQSPQVEAATWTAPNSPNYEAAAVYISPLYPTTSYSFVDFAYGSPGGTRSYSYTAPDIGAYKIGLRSRNGSGVLSAIVETPFYLTDRIGNLAASADDLTASSWVKSEYTATLNGTTPNGKTPTRLLETATAGATHAAQLATIGTAAGQTVKCAVVLSRVGRAQVYLRAISADFTEGYDVIFNFNSNTVTGGGAYGGATAPVFSVVQLSADYFIVMWQCVRSKAGTSLIIYGLDDTGALSYTGDTAKGLRVYGVNVNAV